MIVDIHSHLYSPSWYPQVFQDYLARQFYYERNKDINDIGSGIQKINMLLTDDSGEKTIAVMNKIGIDKKVVSIIDFGIELGEAEKSILEIHKEILGICGRHHERLIGFAGVDPRRPEAEEIVKMAFNELGARGLKLHPTSNGWTLLDDNVNKLIKLTEQMGLPVLVHTGQTIDILSSQNSGHEQIITAARKNENVMFIAGHSSFESWQKYIEDEYLPHNIYFDISGWQKRRKGNEGQLKKEIQNFIVALKGRVFWGSDSPFLSYNVPLIELEWLRFVQSCLRELGNEIQNEFFYPKIMNYENPQRTDNVT